MCLRTKPAERCGSRSRTWQWLPVAGVDELPSPRHVQIERVHLYCVNRPIVQLKTQYSSVWEPQGKTSRVANRCWWREIFLRLLGASLTAGALFFSAAAIASSQTD